MAAENLSIQTFGNFTLRYRTVEITENDTRSRKTWLLLAFLLVNRNRSVSQDELLTFLWNDEEKNTNPNSAMKTMLHRLRTMLDQLWVGAGHELIVRRDGSYGWNNEIPVSVDFESFDALCSQAMAAQDDTERIERSLEAIRLYKGDFLPKLSMEDWTIPIETFYRNRYLQLVLSVSDPLLDRSRYEEMIEIGSSAVSVDPYNETVYEKYFTALLMHDDRQRLISAYEKLRDMLFNNFGTVPGKILHDLYREALQRDNSSELIFDDLGDALREQNQKHGAMVCDFDYFKTICHAQVRFMKRSGDVAHVALFTIGGPDGKPLADRTLSHTMDSFGEEIRLNLRSGDVAAPCSSSQYLVLLAQANYENSNMVCERLLKSFNRHFPHSQALISFRIHPLSQDI